MTTEEEIKLKLGFDATAVARGTQMMLDSQKRAANDYVTFWKKAIADVERAEISADVRAASRANKAAQLRRERAVISAERQAVINAEIGAGSIPANLAGGALGEAAAAGAAKSASHGGLGGIVRELAVLGREAASGNWRRALGSLTILIQRMSTFGIVAARVGGILAAVVGAGEIARASIRAGRAADQSKLSTTGLADQSKTLGAALGLGPNATHEEVMRKQKELLDAQRKADDEASARAQKQLEIEQEKEATAKRHLQIQENYERSVERSAALNREASGLRRQARDAIHAARMIDQETVTIEDLSGRDFNGRLNKDYGAGGRFDLGKGDGPFAKAAQDYELAQKQQQWDIIHGNAKFNDKGELIGGEAYRDRLRELAAHDKLAGAGLDTPAMKFSEMRDSLKSLDKDMAELVRRAGSEGLKIADHD